MYELEVNEILKLKQEVTKNIIGQDEGLNKLIAFFYKTSNFQSSTGASSNLLLIGPSGCGKTYAVKEFAKQLNRRFFQVDGASITAEGYKGANLTSILENFYESCTNKHEFEHCILLIDEIDKIIIDEQNSNYGVRVQSNFLKLLNHDSISIGERGSILIDTSNMIIILAGAFSGIFNNFSDIGVTKRKNLNNESLTNATISKKLIAMGYSHEFVGRISNYVIFNSLNDESLSKIIRNRYEYDYKRFFENEGIILEMPDEVVKYILEKTSGSEMNSRMIDSYFEDVVLDVVFNVIPDERVGKVQLKVEDDKLTYEKFECNRTYPVIKLKCNEKNIRLFRIEKDIDKLADKFMHYLNEKNYTYDNITSMYYLFKTILGYLKYNCREDDQSTESIAKLIDCAFNDDSSKTVTTFDIMIDQLNHNLETNKQIVNDYEKVKYYGLFQGQQKAMKKILKRFNSHEEYIS